MTPRQLTDSYEEVPEDEQPTCPQCGGHRIRLLDSGDCSCRGCEFVGLPVVFGIDGDIG